MKDKIDVKICIGTYSYVMGGADLVNLDMKWPKEWKDKVQVSGAISIDGCNEKTMKPPYASVNGKLITEASEEKLKKSIQEELSLLTD